MYVPTHLDEILTQFMAAKGLSDCSENNISPTAFIFVYPIKR